MNKNREMKFHQTLNLPPRSVKNGKHRRTRKKAHRDPADRAGDSAGGAITWLTGRLAPQPTEPTIPYAGVRTGELIGWRAWWVINDHDLRSLAHHFVWQPGSVVSGDINKVVEDNWSWFGPYWFRLKEGVYAHLNRQQTADDLAEHRRVHYPVQIIRDNGWAQQEYTTDTFIGLVIGRVKMWGEVVEHERGYRAQFARILSLDEKYGVFDLDKLRQKYLP